MDAREALAISDISDSQSSGEPGSTVTQLVRGTREQRKPPLRLSQLDNHIPALRINQCGHPSRDGESMGFSKYILSGHP